MSETGNNQDQEHLRLLAIFHFVCAGLIAVCACIPLIHLAPGVVMLFAPEIFGNRNDQPPRSIGLLFTPIAGFFIVSGGTLAALLAWAGRCFCGIRRTRSVWLWLPSRAGSCRSERSGAGSRSLC